MDKTNYYQLDCNSGSGSASGNWSYSSGVYSQTFDSGSTIGTLPTPTRSGYRFTGWFTQTSGGTKISISTTVTATVTYYSQWVQEFTVSLNCNNGSGSASDGWSYSSGIYSKTFDTGSAIGTLPTSTRTDYFFTGWYTQISGRTQINSSTTVTAAVTYYAHWNNHVIIEVGYASESLTVASIGSFIP